MMWSLIIAVSLLTVAAVGMACFAVPRLVSKTAWQQFFARQSGMESDPFDKKLNQVKIKEASEVLKHDPTDLAALKKRAIAFENSFEYEDALADYDRLIKLEPEHVQWYEHRAEQLGDLERYKEALEARTTVISMVGKTAENLIARADVFFNLKDNKKALADLAESEKDIPASNGPDAESTYTKASNNKDRAELYNKLGLQDKYLAYLNQTISASGDDNFEKPDALRERAAYYIDRGQYAIALKDYNQLIEDDQDSVSYESRADLNLAMGSYKQAISDYQKKLEMLTSENDGADHIRLYGINGELKLYKRLHGEKDFRALAEKRLVKVTEAAKDPDFTESESEIVEFIQLLPTDKGHRLARDTLAHLDSLEDADDDQSMQDLYYYLGEYPRARQVFNSIEKDSHTYHKAAENELKIGNISAAFKLATKSVEMDRLQLCGQEVLAQIYLAKGDLASAKKIQKLIFELKKQNVDADWPDEEINYKIAIAEGKAAEADKYLRQAAANGKDFAVVELLKRGESRR